MSRPLRLGFDATNILGHGGIKTYARELIRSLAIEAPDCNLLLFTTRSRSKQDTLRELFGDMGNVAVHPGLPHARMLGNRLRGLTDLAGSMAWRSLARRVDLVHLTDAYSSTGTPVRFISTIHDIFPLTRPEHAGTSLRRDYQRRTPRILSRSSAVIVPSEFVSGQISELFPESAVKVRVIAEAASSEYSPRCRVPTKTAGTAPPYFLFIGRPDIRKNLPRILQAFGMVRSGIPELKLRLVLSGPPVSLEMPDDASGGSIEMIRNVSVEELASLYSSALGMVFPSLDEGFGLPVLEAMRCGCPVIASVTGSLPEVAGEAALLVNPLDVEEIASAMTDLALSPELRERLSMAGIDRASEFTWKKTAHETLHVYRSRWS